MKQVRAYPPNYVELAAAFPWIKGRQGLLYAWGDRVYNPSGITIPPQLWAHEEVHGQQQGDAQGGVEAWWEEYIRDPDSRFHWELEAHRAEFAAYVGNHASRATYLDTLAARLSGPLYGNLLTLDEARKEITA